MALFDKDIIPDSRRHIVRELVRLNDNFERYLDHLHVPPRASKEQIAISSGSSYVGEPISELEQAMKEHAELTGQTWPRTSE
jgi:hypothetical protein